MRHRGEPFRNPVRRVTRLGKLTSDCRHPSGWVRVVGFSPCPTNVTERFIQDGDKYFRKNTQPWCSRFGNPRQVPRILVEIASVGQPTSILAQHVTACELFQDCKQRPPTTFFVLWFPFPPYKWTFVNHPILRISNISITERFMGDPTNGCYPRNAID